MSIRRLAAISGLLLLAACSASSDDASDGAGASQDELAAPVLGPAPSGSPAKYPIVLAHGFDASPTNRWGFWRVKEALEADGHVVHVASVPPYAPPEVRAQELAKHVDAALAEAGAKKVNIVAHSMGGLDARVLVSSLGYGDRVASLTTISSPHRGSAVADAALKLVPDAMNAVMKVWGRTFTERDLADQVDLRGALAAISEGNAARFNEEHPDDARVYYQSWAGVSSVLGLPNGKDADACEGKLLRHAGRYDVMDASLVLGATLVAHGTALLPNDGMATVESAKWGTFRGCIPADHLDEVGQPKHDEPNRHTGFDHVRFYRNLAFDLAKRGF